VSTTVAADHLPDEADRGHGLWQRTYDNGQSVITNLRLAGSGRRSGSGLINTAAVLLFLLGVGLLGVSLAAQYRYIDIERHQHLASLIEAGALDVGMIIFSLLALGLARQGQSAKIERALVVACAAGSALMNYAASDVSSPRSVLAFVMPPVFLAVVVDRVVVTIRRHVLGMHEGGSPWSATGRAGLYVLRFALAPPSTAKGMRQAVLQATPMPEAIEAPEKPKAIERPRPRKHRKVQAPSKTSQFLDFVAAEYGAGDIGAIKAEKVYQLARDCGPKFDLHVQSAANALRQAIKRAGES
jgi:hypothetical protein